jgi:MFS transporter, DHA1 family, inner membrane transport protein
VTPVAIAAARDLVPPERAGRAVATVFGGMTVALVLGVPLGSLVGNALSWRVTFALVAAAGAATAATLVLVLPAQRPQPTGATAVRRLELVRQRAVLANLAVTVSWMTGGIAVFTYVGVLLPRVTGVGSTGLSSLLLLFGVATVAGNWVGGVGADRWGSDRTAVTSLVVTAGALAVLAALAGVPRSPYGVALAVAAVAAWGFGDWCITAPQVQRLTAVAPHAVTELLALNSSAIYLGVTLGAALGGVLVTAAPLPALPATGAALQVAALGVVLLSRTAPGRRKRRDGHVVVDPSMNRSE